MGKIFRMGLTYKLFLPVVGILLVSVVLTAILTLSVERKSSTEHTNQYLTRFEKQWKGITERYWAAGAVDSLQSLYRTAVESDEMLNYILLQDDVGRRITSNTGEMVSMADGVRVEAKVAQPGGGYGKLYIGFSNELVERDPSSLITTILVTGLSTIFAGAFVYM